MAALTSQLRELGALPRYAISAAQAADCDPDDVNDPLTIRCPERQTKPGDVWAAAGDSPPASSDDISTSTAPTAGTGVAGMVSGEGCVGQLWVGNRHFNRMEALLLQQLH